MKRYSKEEIREVLGPGAADPKEKIAVLEYACEQLLSDNEEMEKALEFYANRGCYQTKLISKSSFEQYEPSSYSPMPVLEDLGERARITLHKLRGERD